MSAPISADQLVGRTAVDADGDKIGKIGQVYLNDGTGQPEWITVSTGLFGTKQSFAPVSGSTSTGDNVQLAVSKDLVKAAPQVEDDGHLEDSETEALYQHYAGHLGTSNHSHGDHDHGDHDHGDHDHSDHDHSEHVETTGTTGTTGTDYNATGHDTSGPNTDDAMTRSEERLNVGTQNVETGRARLRKYIVSENVETTVPVSREEVRVDREPITDANVGDALSGADLSEEEHEVVLHEERPVVAKETVPVERVRMGTETVTGEQTVSEEVRKEQIEVDGDTTGTTGTTGDNRSL